MLENIMALCIALLGGVNILQFFFFRSTKRKYEADADKAKTSALRDKVDLHQDQYDYVNTQLTKIQQDYYGLADNYRKNMTDHLQEIDIKCNEIAELKSKLVYFKGLRCYKSDCGMRIRENPYKDSLITKT